MKTRYQIISACTITCVVTAFATTFIIKHNIIDSYSADEFICKGDATPDEHGCCPGETYTDMGDQGFNCCPDGDYDCFPPITK